MLLRALVALGPSHPSMVPVRACLDECGFTAVEFLHQASDLAKALERDEVDAVVVGRTLLGSKLKHLLPILKVPSRPGIVVLAPDEDPRERARLLAWGCLAVLWEGLKDAAFHDALSAVLIRHRDAIHDRRKAARASEQYSLDDFVARSAAMKDFIATAQKVVQSSTSLLILGETGVGKERLARAIHEEGPRNRSPFIAVNCGALPEALLESELFGHDAGAFTGAATSRRGYFEMAHGGTLFLDEIGEIPIHLQVKLLRALDERHIYRVGGERRIAVDVRIMAATNRDLKAALAAKLFRADLYYRLAVVTLVLPPLRARVEDIAPLARSYLAHFGALLGRRGMVFSPDALGALTRYAWPGNVRELINIVERAVLLAAGNEIRLSELPAEMTGAPSCESVHGGPMLPVPLFSEPIDVGRSRVVADYERRYLTEVLFASHGRIALAAKRAGVNERTLYDLMKRRGLRKEDFKIA